MPSSSFILFFFCALSVVLIKVSSSQANLDLFFLLFLRWQIQIKVIFVLIVIKLLMIDICFKVWIYFPRSSIYFLSLALDKMWHEDCLKCACCDCRLGETGSTLYLKANLILCKRDYLRLFGMTGHCASCQKLSKNHRKIWLVVFWVSFVFLVPAFDLVMRCGELVYHLNCFSCYECQQKYVVWII